MPDPMPCGAGKPLLPVQMKTSLLLVLLCLSITADGSEPQVHTPPIRYAQSVIPTPVLNTPEFSSVFGTRAGEKTVHDTAGRFRELEFIALPDTVFTIESVIKQGANTIYRVTTIEYPFPSPDGYYIDSRFVRTAPEKPPDRAKRLPDKNTIITSLLSSEGSAYLWGGNLKEGIPQMLALYPPPAFLSREERSRWMLQGLDCSGLLYQAADGCTPRNTSALITFGEPVPIVNIPVPQIIQAVEPLDIIVWPGHVIIVLDRERVIESRPDYDALPAGIQGGVRIRKIGEVLSEVLGERIPVNHYETAGAVQKQFVIRRWYPRRSHH